MEINDKIMEDIEALRQVTRQEEFTRDDEQKLKAYDKLWKGYNLLIRNEQNRIFAERNLIVMDRFKAMYPKYFGQKEAPKEIAVK